MTVRNKRGYAHQEWQKMRERNEALDCRVYARAAAWIMGADRWDEATWRRLEAQAGVETRMPITMPMTAEAPDPAQPKAGTPDRASTRSDISSAAFFAKASNRISSDWRIPALTR